MMPKKAGDEVSGELLARGYWQVLGSNLSEAEMNSLTDLVLNKCKWFPTVAECREIMAESDYTNPFYVSRMQARLEANGYSAPRLTAESHARLTDETTSAPHP